MKLYYVGPRCDRDTMSEEQMDTVTRAAIEPIADLILQHFRPDGFNALIGLTVLNRPWPDPDPQTMPTYPPLSPGTQAFGRYRVTQFQSEGEVRAVLLNMGDPNPHPSRTFFCVRSLLSCRSVTYGFDGQAFLCLHTEDPAPTPADKTLVLVSEESAWLTTTDYMDGVAMVHDW